MRLTRSEYENIRAILTKDSVKQGPEFEDLTDAQHILLRQSLHKGAENGELDAPLPEYKLTACDGCGIIVPRNELHQRTQSRVSGYSSGSSWTSSLSSSTDSRGRYNPNRRNASRRSGYSAGTIYYRTEILLLCDECCRAHDSHKRADAVLIALLWLIPLSLIVGSYLLAMGPKVPSAEQFFTGIVVLVVLRVLMGIVLIVLGVFWNVILFFGKLFPW